jgi:hypothetical protein
MEAELEVVQEVVAADVPLEISTVFPNGLHNVCSCGSRWLLLLLLLLLPTVHYRLSPHSCCCNARNATCGCLPHRTPA